jgi:hypothetical protein
VCKKLQNVLILHAISSDRERNYCLEHLQEENYWPCQSFVLTQIPYDSLDMALVNDKPRLWGKSVNTLTVMMYRYPYKVYIMIYHTWLLMGLYFLRLSNIAHIGEIIATDSDIFWLYFNILMWNLCEQLMRMLMTFKF